MRKRSKYRPYRTDRSAWAHAIGMQQQLTNDQLVDLGFAVHACIERLRTGKWAFDGSAYVALTRAVELHEAQLASITRDSARAAMLEVRRRVERGETLNKVPA